MDDILESKAEGITFYGNQIIPPALDPTKPVDFAEFFTGESCGNCPPAAAHLHEMQNTFGGQFIYVEYCNTNDYTPFYLEKAQYYSAYSQPTTLVQGTNVVVGGASENLEAIDGAYENESEKVLSARISEINITTDNVGEISGNLNLELLQDISTENLILTVVIADKKPDIFYNGTTERFHNVAFEKTEIIISEAGVKDFTISYDETIDFKHKKVIAWLQTQKETFDTTCIVHAAAELSIAE